MRKDYRYDVAAVAHVFDLLVLLISFLVCVSAAATDNSYPVLIKKDMETMQALSQHLPLIPGSHYYWNTTHPNPCFWGDNRVTCSSLSSSKPFSRVTELHFRDIGLYMSSSTTHFFQLLCRLDALEKLDLSSNSFTAIPTSFFSNCTGLSTSLKDLDLHKNQLTGPLNNFSNFHALQRLDLSYNTLEGPVSSQFFDGLSNLKVLSLNNNFFNGTIPEYSCLELLDLSLNHYFDGPIPIEIFQSTNLTFLSLGHNNLSGTIPDEIGQLSKLEGLDLSSNSLTGTIPDAIGQLAKLNYLDLSFNSLTCIIPTSLSSIKTLQTLSAQNNFLSGTIPLGISRHLKQLRLEYNNLSGGIPPDLLSPPNLTYVRLCSNFLQGPLPQNYSQQLQDLILGNNFLNGIIPPQITQLQKLDTLCLDGNELHGEIPHQLENCQSLRVLNLTANKLQGKLPKELGNLAQLQEMALQDNVLSGEIPSEFSKLAKLTTLNLEGNKLSSSIPDTIVNLNSLQELQLGNNKLSGPIPRMPSSMSSTLNLSSNLFSGPIPSYLGILNQLRVLDLSSNNFTGEVPYALSKMENLEKLVVSNNQLSGTLPSFHSWVTVIASGNNFTEENTFGSRYTETNKTIVSKQAILIMIAAFVSGFVVAILGATITQQVISRCCYQAKNKKSSATRNSSQPAPMDNFEKMRVRHQLYVANRRETKNRARNSGM